MELKGAEQNHMIENGITLVLGMLVCSRLIKKKMPDVSRLRRWFLTMGGSVPATYLINKIVLKPILMQELEDAELTEKYLKLDLDEEMMRTDLDQMGIRLRQMAKQAEKQL